MKIKFEIEIDVPKLFIVAEGGDKSILTKYEFSEINKSSVYEGIYTHEGNEHVSTWNHEIILEELPGNGCRYTDKVDIDAGWKNVFVWLWANCFYAHRQKRWIKLLGRKR